jgi:hypothetical protein
MTQLITVPNVTSANFDLLDGDLKAAAPSDCFGITGDVNGLSIVVSDTIAAPLLQTLKLIVQNHNPNAKTPAQQAEASGKVDTAALITAADTALAQLTSKLATFQATPNLANAGPLLIEITQDLIALIKFNKYMARKNI